MIILATRFSLSKAAIYAPIVLFSSLCSQNYIKSAANHHFLSPTHPFSSSPDRYLYVHLKTCRFLSIKV